MIRYKMSDKLYHLREASEMCERLGRPLTDKEVPFSDGVSRGMYHERITTRAI